jgi:hypothetical protein
MTFTKSKDGALRATVLIKFRVDRQMMVDIIAYRTSHYGYEPPATKKEVWCWVHDALHESGQGVWIGADGHIEQEALDKIYALVDRLFPQLQPQ